MSKEDHGFDIATSLGRIEAKVDALNDTISKVVYALLAIVAATVGVEFLPRSPIDWYGATLFTQRFFSIASMMFLSIMLFTSIRYNGRVKVSSDQRRYLALGLLALAFILLLGMFSFPIGAAGIWFYVGTLLRMIYTVSFTKYAWCLRIRLPPAEPTDVPFC
jgi:hypothetical protein